MLSKAAVAWVIVSGKTCRERSKNRTVIQLGTHESVSIIEIICADGCNGTSPVTVRMSR